MIQRLLPHRYPMLLVDRVLDCEAGRVHSRPQERDRQRAVLPGAFPRIPGDAGRARHRGAGAGRGPPHDALRVRAPRRQPAGAVRRHRRGAFQAAGGARGHADARSQPRAGRPRRRPLRGRGRRSATSSSARRPCWRRCATCRRCRPCLSSHVPAIHPTALVDPGAELADDVEIGPYSIVGRQRAHRSRDAHRAARRHRRPHDDRRCATGSSSSRRSATFRRIASTAASRRPRRSATTTSSANTSRSMRERRRTGATTTIGNGNWMLAYTHVAHDCVVGNQTTFSNNAQIAGHVSIGDFAVLGAFCGRSPVLPRGRAHDARGRSDRAAGRPAVRDGGGLPGEAAGTNNEGLRRRGFSPADIARRASRLQDALPGGPVARRARAPSSRRRRPMRRCSSRWSTSSPYRAAASCADRARFGVAAASVTGSRPRLRRRKSRRRVEHRSQYNVQDCSRATPHRDPQAGVHGLRALRPPSAAAPCEDARTHGRRGREDAQISRCCIRRNRVRATVR